MSNIHTPTDQVLSKCLSLGTIASGPSAIIDTQGFTRVKFIIAATTAASSTLDASVYESNQSGLGALFNQVPGSAIATVPASQANEVELISVNLDVRKRYLRIQASVAGTVTGFIGAELYNADEKPVSQDNPPVVV